MIFRYEKKNYIELNIFECKCFIYFSCHWWKSMH